MRYSLYKRRSASPPLAHLAEVLIFGIGICTFSAVAVAQTPNFGPNVYILDPSMPAAQVQSTLISLSNEAQFSTNRYAVLFKPGAYTMARRTAIRRT